MGDHGQLGSAHALAGLGEASWNAPMIEMAASKTEILRLKTDLPWESWTPSPSDVPRLSLPEHDFLPPPAGA
jgi:hypothetical protein